MEVLFGVVGASVLGVAVVETVCCVVVTGAVTGWVTGG